MMRYVIKNGIPQCRKPGVYLIRNLVNDKVYVGSSINVCQRLGAHRSYLRGGKHFSHRLQASWNKYGEAAFRFEVVQTCASERAFGREEYWIARYESTDPDCGYNISEGAGRLGREHSAETKAMWSKKRKGIIPVAATAASALLSRGVPRSAKVRKAISKAHKGKKKSPEHCAAIAATHWTKKPGARAIIDATNAKNRGRKHSKATKAKISASCKGVAGRPRGLVSAMIAEIRKEQEYRIENRVRFFSLMKNINARVRQLTKT